MMEMKCDRPFQLNIHNILKVNPKCANSGHFKLTIDGLLGAITQTMEVGWGDSEDCVLAVQSWQRLITDIIIITRLNIWMLSLLSQYGSGGGQWPVCGKRPHLTGLPLNIADCRLSQQLRFSLLISPSLFEIEGMEDLCPMSPQYFSSWRLLYESLHCNVKCGWEM